MNPCEEERAEERLRQFEEKVKRYLVENIYFLEIHVDKKLKDSLMDFIRYEREDSILIDCMGQLKDNYVLAYTEKGDAYAIPYSMVKMVKIKGISPDEHNALVYARYIRRGVYWDRNGKPIERW